jgi:hypothetical protein
MSGDERSLKAWCLAVVVQISFLLWIPRFYCFLLLSSFSWGGFVYIILLTANIFLVHIFI